MTANKMNKTPQWKKLRIKRIKGRSSSIGAKILSFVFRQLTEDFKVETLKMNLSNMEYQEGRGGEGSFPRKSKESLWIM